MSRDSVCSGLHISAQKQGSDPPRRVQTCASFGAWRVYQVNYSH